MNRNRVLLSVLLFVILALPINVCALPDSPSSAREYSDPLMRKLNDFLPTYTPFTPLESPDRYFPDEVGKKVADAIVQAYLQNPAGVEQRTRELAEHEAKLVTAGEQPTGLTTYLVTLLNQPSSTDADLATVSSSADALLQQANQLLAEEKRQRVGRRFNWILSTFDVGSLLFGAPRAPSPYGAQGIVSEWSGGNDPAPRERKALVFYREFLRRFPEDPRTPEVTQKARDLETRRTQAMLNMELARAETAFKKHDYWGANFHYHLALMVDESSTKARAGLEQVAVRLQQKEDFDLVEPRDPLADLKQAEWEHDKQTFQYLLPGSGFVKDNFVVAGGGNFLDDVGHVPRRDELGFLDVDDAAGLGGSEKKIRLAREKSGDLQDVAGFCGRGGLRGIVDVGEDRNLEIGFNFAEDAKAFDQARAAEGFYRRSIGLVVGGFEDVGNLRVGGDFGDALGHGARVRFGFDDAGSGNEEERIAAAETERVELDFVSCGHSELGKIAH